MERRVFGTGGNRLASGSIQARRSFTVPKT